MDFIIGLPKSQDFDVIMVMVNKLLKYAHFILFKCPFIAKMVVQSFVKEVVKLQRVPKAIINDKDSVFLNNFWEEMFQLQGTKLKIISSNHPQTDGQMKVIKHCLETYLWCFTLKQPKN